MRPSLDRRPLAALAAAVSLAALFGCQQPHDYLAGDSGEHPRLRLVDGDVSANHRCPVTRSKLNPGIEPVYVNGRPVGFC